MYDWQADHESFKKWALVTMITKMHNAAVEDLSEKTKHFTEIDFGITINGVVIDGDDFFKRLEEAFDGEVKREAQRMLDENVELTDIQDRVHDLGLHLQEEIHRAFPNFVFDQED